MLAFNAKSFVCKEKKRLGELPRAIQKRQCLGCAERETHGEDTVLGSVLIA